MLQRDGEGWAMIVVRDLPWVFLCYKSRPRPSQRLFLKVLLISSHLFLLYLSSMKWYGFSVICNLKCVWSFVLLARLFIFGLNYNLWAGWECIFYVLYLLLCSWWLNLVSWMSKNIVLYCLRVFLVGSFQKVSPWKFIPPHPLQKKNSWLWLKITWS